MVKLKISRIVTLVLAILSVTTGPAPASVITTGDVDPGGAATQLDPWAVGGNLFVGKTGFGTLNVEAGGVVSNTEGLIGLNSGSTGEVTVTGFGSQWNHSSDLFVGDAGEGALNVTDSGIVSNSVGYIGFYSGSTGEATVTGSGSQWNNLGYLVVGVSGTGTLNVEAGGVVANTYGVIGNHYGSTGAVTVTGTGSQWNNSHNLLLGYSSDGTLNIEAGGMVSSRLGGLGWNGSSTGVATVTGSGSQWNNLDTLVGLLGDGTLNVEAGGVVSNTDGYIGRDSGSTSEATVTGSGSQWTNSNSLYVGGDSSQAGGSGTLNLNDSGLVTVSSTTTLWSTGIINLDGGNLTTGSFDNSETGALHFNDGTLTVNGASGVFNPGTGDFTIDGNTATDLPELVIADTASATLTEFLKVGSSRQGKLTIEAGGVVSNTTGYIGHGSTSTGMVTVTGSQWNNSDTLYVGYLGDAALNVEAGGVVSNTHGLIGDESGSTGQVTVTGSGSQWNNSADLAVGRYGNGTLNVEAGGVVANTYGYIGRFGGSTGEATVTGPGSQWNNSDELAVGFYDDGTLNVEAGGVVFSILSGIGWNGQTTGVVTVTGSGSRWNNSSDLYVGLAGNGILNVDAGGIVSNTDSIIGRFAESTGEATVTGSGSQWNNSGDLVVGEEGDGTLNIENEGLVTVGGTTSIGATGTVNLTGGRFEFGQTSLVEFSTINTTAGAMAGDVMITGVNDAASLTALQNPAVDMNDVAAVNNGLLHGSAILKSSLDNQPSGELRTTSSDWVRFEGSGNINSGELNNFGGQVDFAQDMTNETNGFIGGRGQFVADGGWTNQGVMAFSGTADILGDVDIEPGGKLIASGGATTTIFDDLVNNGVVKVSENSAVVYFGSVSGSGSFTGSGTTFLEGDLSPGSSPGTMSFGGDVVLGKSSTTLIELAGTANAEYDRLLVAGELELSGALEVQLLDGFAPINETAFEILNATDLSGEFSSLVLPNLLGNLSWDSSLLYSNGTLSVIPEPAMLSLLAVAMLMACRRRRRCG